MHTGEKSPLLVVHVVRHLAGNGGKCVSALSAANSLFEFIWLLAAFMSDDTESLAPFTFLASEG